MVSGLGVLSLDELLGAAESEMMMKGSRLQLVANVSVGVRAELQKMMMRVVD